MKKSKILVLSAILFVAAFAIAATVNFSNDVSANHIPEVISECDIVRQLHNTPPTNPWVLYTRDTGSGAFVLGPADPPLSDGSLSLNTPLNNDKVYLFNYEHIGTPLSSITELIYSTYRSSASTAEARQLPAINLVIDYNGSAPGGFATLVYEPVYNNANQPIVDDTWQSWNTLQGTWWSTQPIPGTNCSGATAACDQTWAQIIQNNPFATINGGFGVNQGGGNPGLFANTDALTIAYNGHTYAYNFDVDADCDDVADGDDNCPNTPNPGQADADNDKIGDACDSDSDGDGVPNTTDNCPTRANADQLDTDGDGAGNACDADDDGDGDVDNADNCPLTSNPNQEDTDGDGIGDACDSSTKPTNKDQCKNGGYTRFNDPAFSNQGQCIQYVNTGK